MNHPEIQGDLLVFSVLSAVGQLVIYRMVKMFKQHIVPFVIATRKCVTVVVNIVHFGHSLNAKQFIGMCIVFFAIILEVTLNMREKDGDENKARNGEKVKISTVNDEISELKEEEFDDRAIS